jgi:hypothetical protein
VPFVAAIALLVVAGPVSAASPDPMTAADKPATTLRLTLGRLLAVHAFLTMEGMRAVALHAPERDAITESLGQNTDDLANAIGSVYGQSAHDAFRPLWQSHIDALMAYADDASRGDETAAAQAKQQLATFRVELSQFLKGANPQLSGAAEAAALQMHIAQLTAYVDGDFSGAMATGRAAYSHMFELGDHLAKAIATQFPRRYPGRSVAFSPKAELRVALGKLLGEHLVLSAEAMRSGMADTPDAAGTRDALAANTRDLGSWIASLYGASAGTAFDEIWTRHIDAYLAYIAAVKTKDTAGQQQALERLHTYHVQVAEFLTAANPKLDRAEVEELIRRHVESLIAQVDAYAAGDYRRSVNVVREAYDHMFVVGDVFAEATAAQFPDRFSDVEEIPPTDTAIEIDRPAQDASAAATVAFLAALAALAVWARRRPRSARSPF